MTLVLVVDDVAPLAEQYAYDLRRIGGYEVLTAPGGAKALETLAAAPVDCVVLDLEMPGMDGFEVLRALERKGSQVPVIVYTGTGSYDRCVQAMRLGAYGFIDKAEPMERVVHEIETAMERRRLRSEVSGLRRQLGRETSLVGGSAAMTELREAIARVAPIPSPVLILGESGTGKELVARDLHRFGPQPRGPFVAINCAALPESLVESELFGHERGAFTGAVGTRKGAFEAAERGTLFLDEIGELPLRAAGQAAARAGGAAGHPARRQQGDRGRGARRRRDEPRPRGRGAGGPLPGGSLLPARTSTRCGSRRSGTGCPTCRRWWTSS